MSQPFEPRRVCRSCSEGKPGSEFYIDKRRGSLRSECRSCQNRRSSCNKAVNPPSLERRKEYKRRECAKRRFARAPSVLARAEALRQKAEINQARVAARTAWIEWLARAPDWWLAARTNLRRGQAVDRARARYSSDPVRERDRVRRYKHANPDKVQAWQGKRGRQAAQRNDRTLTASIIKQLFADAKTCPYDGGRLAGRATALDHIIALTNGGAHSLVNVVVCCDDCNHRKLGRPFDVWLTMLTPPNRRRALRLYRLRYGCDPEQRVLELAFAA